MYAMILKNEKEKKREDVSKNEMAMEFESEYRIKP